jgi:hypothetical protein
MTGAGAHGYNLRSKDKTKVEHCDPVFESFDQSSSSSSMVPSTPRRRRPPTWHTGRKDIKVDPSESAFFESGRTENIICRSTDATFLSDTDTAELRAPRKKNATPPSTPDIPRPRKGMESRGLQGGSTAPSDAGEETRRGDIRARRSTSAELEAARLGVELQRRRDARRIRREQRAKRLRMESWALTQRAALFNRQADELDKLAAKRKMKEGGTFDNDDDSESESSESSESTMMMVCDDDDKEERASERSDTYAPTEVYSESEQQTWALMH